MIPNHSLKLFAISTHDKFIFLDVFDNFDKR